MMRTRGAIVVSLTVLFAVASVAEASPWSRRQATRNNAPARNTRAARNTPADHGQRAYSDALQFARTNNLAHFTVRSRGVERLVVNVPSSKLSQWCSTFSKGRCYIEPFFNASKSSAPSWSMLRIGDKSYQKYGTGSPYRTSTNSCRVAFPISLSSSELVQTKGVIETSRNGSFSYNGGDPHTNGRNCTNWLTSKIGQYTGVRTASVKHHMKSLVTGYHSNRMTVMAVMSPGPIQNFGQDQLRINWSH